MLCGRYNIKRSRYDDGSDIPLVKGWFSNLSEEEALKEIERFRTKETFNIYIEPCFHNGTSPKDLKEMFLEHCFQMQSPERN